MAEGSIRTSSRSSRSRKKKVNQIPIALGVLVAIVAVAVWLGTRSASLALYWIVGNCFGFVLQRARFCFTASLRDPYLTKSTSVTRAVLIAFALTSIIFTAIKYGYFANGMAIPGQSYVAPVSIATCVGAFMFGIGMVIAGGCASGTLMRVGEGFGMNMLALLFFIIGSLWGAHDYGWWMEKFIIAGKRIFLPDVFGWIGGLLVNLGILALLYVIAHNYEKKHNNAGDTAE